MLYRRKRCGFGSCLCIGRASRPLSLTSLPTPVVLSTVELDQLRLLAALGLATEHGTAPFLLATPITILGDHPRDAESSALEAL